MVELGLVDWLAGLYARMPDILFGQFYLSNYVFDVGAGPRVMIVRPPLLSGFDEYTFTQIPRGDITTFPYGYHVEPPDHE